MYGDEVRDTRFLGPAGKFTRGYDAAEVDELLDRIAAELDAGRQVRPLIENAVFRARTGTGGYDAQAVDWFLEQLRCREGHSELARMSDPWRDLAVGNYFIRSGLGDPAERTATPPRRAHRKDRAQDQECLAGECADAWRDFGRQPGTQLRWVLTSGRHLWSVLRGELLTAEQQAVASVRSRSPDMDWPATVSAGGRTFTWNGSPDQLGRASPRSSAAATRTTAPDIPSMQIRRTARNPVHPGQQLTDELVLALVISAAWFHSYFTSSGNGG